MPHTPNESPSGMPQAANFTFFVTTQQPRKHDAAAIARINAHVSRHRYLRDGRSKTLVWHQQRIVESIFESDSEGRSDERHEGLTAVSRLQNQLPQNPVLESLGLDPFLHLPLDISARDQRLLQFYLTEGRVLQRGTTAEPQYCPALEVCRALLPKSKVMLLVTLVTADFVLCAINKVEPMPKLTQRLQQARWLLHNELTTGTTNTYDRVFWMLHMIFLEGIFGHTGFSEPYLRHLDGIMSAFGGVGAFLTKIGTDASYSIQKRYIPSMYVVAEISFSSEQEFLRAHAGFRRSLRKTREWCLNIQQSNCNFSQNRIDLLPLCSYLTRLVDTQLLCPRASFLNTSGAFYCCHDLILTLTQYHECHDDVLAYLMEVQRQIVAHRGRVNTTNKMLQPLQLLANTHNLATIRGCIDETWQQKHGTGGSQEQLSQISQLLVHGQKLFALMPSHVRSKLTRMFCQAALCITEGLYTDLLEADFLEAVETELIRAWQSRRALIISADRKTDTTDQP